MSHYASPCCWALLVLSAGCSPETSRTPSVAELADQLYEEAEVLHESEEPEACRRAGELYEKALALYLELGNVRRQAEAHTNLGRIHRKFLEDMGRAVEHYSQALEGFESLDDEDQQAYVLNNLGRSLFRLGRMDEAERTWRRAIEINRRTGNVESLNSSLANLALISRYSGDIQAALGHYGRGLAIFRQMGSRENLGVIHNNRGQFFVSLGEDERALADLEEALKIAEEIDSPRRQGIALSAIGGILRRRGDPQAAFRTLTRALELRQEVGDRRGFGLTLRALGATLEDLGRSDEALEHHRRALAVLGAAGATRYHARTLVDVGRLSVADEPPEEVEELYRQALTTLRELGDPEGTIEALVALADLERRRGDLENATGTLSEVLEIVEGVRSSAAGHDLRSSYLASRHDHFGLLIDLLMERHHADPEAGFDRRAFDVAERARARSLLELLAESRENLRVGADADLVARERALTRRVAHLHRERLDRLDRRGSSEETSMIQSQLDQLLGALRVVRSEIRAQSPRYAALIEPTAVGSVEVQSQILDADTLLLAYQLGTERSFLWVLTPTTFESHELPPRRAIEALAERTSKLLRQSHLHHLRGSVEEAARALSSVVLLPAATTIADHRRVLISPAGMLHRVPFGALPLPPSTATSAVPGWKPDATDEGASAGPLLDAHEVVVVPSASALATHRRLRHDRRSPEGLLAIFADPVYDTADERLKDVLQDDKPEARSSWPRLRHSSAELDAIETLVGTRKKLVALGFSATREAVLSVGLGDFRYLHFATHARVDSRWPELSGLMLSQVDSEGRSRDGLLYAHDVFNLDLLAELVTLSACETGLGPSVRGEGFVGLTQSFLYAGAAGVVVSLWRVDDRATAELMAHLYRHLLVNQRSPPAALRAAQHDLRDAGWQAPYYWAGFVIQGEWR